MSGEIRKHKEHSQDSSCTKRAMGIGETRKQKKHSQDWLCHQEASRRKCVMEKAGLGQLWNTEHSQDSPRGERAMDKTCLCHYLLPEKARKSIVSGS